MTQQTIILTGATGFLGSHLLRTFLSQGHKVVILKRRHSNLSRIESLMEGLSVYDWDTPSIEQAFIEQKKVDAVIHTAVSYGRQGESLDTVLEANVALPLRLLEIAMRLSAATFYNADTALPGDFNVYASSKKQFRDWGKRMADTEKIKFVNIKLEHMYGPGDAAFKFATYVIKSCLANVPYLDLTAGGQKRDFIFIDDVVSAYSTLLQKASSRQEAFQEYELGSGTAVSIRNFVELVHELACSKTHLRFGALPPRSNELMHSEGNLAALEALGWFCQFSLREGIRLTMEKELTV